MRRIIAFLLFLFAPSFARANPVILDPTSFIAFGIVAFGALIVEAGIVTLTLAFTGVALLRIFIVFFMASLSVFAFVFFPLIQEQECPLSLLEFGVVMVDGLMIKALTNFEIFQDAGFQGVTWRRSLVASCVGNAASFFVGVFAHGSPWQVQA